MSTQAVEPSPSAPATDAPVAQGGLAGYARQWLDNVFDRHHLSRPTVQITPTVLNMIMPLIERSNLLGFASKLNLLAGRNHLREVVLKETTMLRRMGLSYRRDTYLSPAALRLIKIIRGTTLD